MTRRVALKAARLALVMWISPALGELCPHCRLNDPPFNLTRGDDGATLYITADTALYRVRTRTRGIASTEAP